MRLPGGEEAGGTFLPRLDSYPSLSGRTNSLSEIAHI